jgi:4-hydroxy-tetrahydrodipicolinate synthase
MIATLSHKALEGDLKGSKAINDQLFDINKVLFIESNPIPIKAAMYIAGLLPTLEYRLPLVAPSSETMKKLEETLKNYNVKGL